VNFHVLPTEAFAYGTRTIAIEGVNVNIGDPERTLLDALDYPDLIGGVRQALELVKPALKRVDRDRLIQHAVRGSRASTCQRLGVLLERLATPDRTLVPLLHRTEETSSVLSMVPDRRRTRRVNKKWRVVENDAWDDQPSPTA